MAGLEADTSSYNQPLPVSPLDIANKLGGMQQQKLGIDQAKLDQANQGLQYMVRAMGSLGPNASKEEYAKAAQNAVDLGLVPQQQENTFLQGLQDAVDSPTFYKRFMSSAMEAHKQIELHTGINSSKNDNAVEYQGKTSPLTGGFTPATKMPVQQAPGANYYDENNQQKLLPAAGPSGVVPAAPVQARRLPVERPAMPVQAPQSGATGPQVDKTPVTPTSFDNRFAGAFPHALNAGPTPLFDEGKKAYTEDQTLAAGKMTAVKPALLAMKLLPGLQTGPGTEQWNKAVAFLKAQGLVKTGAENDPTVVYQEADKYFHQYLKQRGGRSDADLSAAEKSSPSVGLQLNPALQNLTRTAVAQDRIEAARANAFEGKNYADYGKHRATFPQSMDERAFSLDMLPKADSEALVRKMAAKYKANPKDAEANKFLNSLHIAKKQGFFDGSE